MRQASWRSSSRWPVALGLAVLGALYGLVTAFFAVAMGGAGHGWAGAYESVTALILVPVLGIALAYRDHDAGLILGLLLAVAMIVVDARIILSTVEGGADEVSRALRGVVSLWTPFWFGWQIGDLWLLWHCFSSDTQLTTASVADREVPAWLRNGDAQPNSQTVNEGESAERSDNS